MYMCVCVCHDCGRRCSSFMIDMHLISFNYISPYLVAYAVISIISASHGLTLLGKAPND